MERHLPKSQRIWRTFATALVLSGAFSPGARSESNWTVASEWVIGTGSRIRLIGAELQVGGAPRLVAGVEIALDDGWKTYWRSPGDSGGIPPTFDWDQSRHIAKAVLLYPAPRRFADPDGVSVGYKKHVVFPIELTPEGQAPVELVVGVFYGVCREICIPAEAELTLTLAPSDASIPSIGEALETALASVPAKLAQGELPTVESVVVATAGGASELLIEAHFDAQATDTDLFAETEDGTYVPMPEKLAETRDGIARFRAALKPEDAKALEGKRLTLTLVSNRGNAEVARKAE
jgi:DsbC/DsbD-like thiol-disulfide interchange protein